MSDRMIVQDVQGRVISVPSDQIPKGARIIRPDVLPGNSAMAAKKTVSEPVNPEKNAEPVIAQPEPQVVEADEQTEEKGSKSSRTK